MTKEQALSVFDLILQQLSREELYELAGTAGVDASEVDEAMEVAIRSKP